MSPEDIRFVYDYNAWANRRSLDAAAPLTVEQFTRPLGSSFSSVRDTLAHIWGAEWIWMERFEGRSPASLPDVGQFHEISALRTRWREEEARLTKLAARVTQSDLNGPHEYRTLKFGQYTNPLWLSMQHLVNHGTYHRGQITTLLRQVGAKPLSTDVIHFYRERAGAANA
jgi:uncharacterized damage-inducible protein DinB